MTSSPKQDVFQAISDPTRRKILELLSDTEKAVNEICGHFPISRTAVTKHLHILLDAGLVRAQKKGRHTFYNLQPEPLLELRRWLSFYEQFWNRNMANLVRCIDTLKLDSHNEK